MVATKKDEWRIRWLGCINELTSLELQKKSWLDRSISNPHWSFVEFMCCYFDDLYIEDNYKYHVQNGFVSESEFELIKDWHMALDAYNSPQNDDYDCEAILSDTKWLEILNIGVEIKNKLASVINEGEREVLIEEINYLDYI